MKTLIWSDLSPADRAAALARPDGRRDPALQSAVRAIVDDVRAGGWDALCATAERLDGQPPRLVPIAAAADQARKALPPNYLEAIDLAHRNITAFHANSVPAEHAVETMPGLRVRKVWRAIDRVGLYIPGGKTPLFSTLLMLAIPARAAGVREIVVVTPPVFMRPLNVYTPPWTWVRPPNWNVDGLDPIVALAAQLCGIDAIWTVGGAQAIAALAFGAGDIPAVDKICGPGNAYVAEAKSYCASLPQGPAIDMPAGPSELMVIADDSADFDFVSSDLLSQAEHDPTAQVLLVTTSPPLVESVKIGFAHFIPTFTRQEIVKASLAHAKAILVDTLEEAVEIANVYAPEHLSLAVNDPDALLPDIRNAGSVFAGHYAAETFGDYVSGSSHVLPTDGAARAWSGISALSFMKSMSIQHVTREAAERIAEPAGRLALLEGLDAHCNAADVRKDEYAT